jgi:AcrR family transcriptional regulator
VVPSSHAPTEEAPARKRADARRNEQALLDAAAAVFVTAGVDAPVREIAKRAGVGMGTIYRHFPTRADLVIAVYRHQVDACADAGPELLARAATPHAALTDWVGMFVEFLTTKHGLAAVLHSDQAGFEALHTYFLDHLVPVCGRLLESAAEAGEVRPGIDPYQLLRGIGNLCIGAEGDSRYDPHLMIELLLTGLRATATDSTAARSGPRARRTGPQRGARRTPVPPAGKDRYARWRSQPHQV